MQMLVTGGAGFLMNKGKKEKWKQRLHDVSALSDKLAALQQKL